MKKLKTPQENAKLSDSQKIDRIKKWIHEELYRWVDVILKVACIHPDEDFEEILQYNLEDLPLEINNWAEGSPQWVFLKRRMANGIDPTDCQEQEWLYWEDFAVACTQYITDPDGCDVEGTDISTISEATTNLYDLIELATLTGDEKLTSIIESWYFHWET